MKANSLKNNEDSLDNTWKWWLTEKRSKTSFFVWPCSPQRHFERPERIHVNTVMVVKRGSAVYWETVSIPQKALEKSLFKTALHVPQQQLIRSIKSGRGGYLSPALHTETGELEQGAHVLVRWDDQRADLYDPLPVLELPLATLQQQSSCYFWTHRQSTKSRKRMNWRGVWVSAQVIALRDANA